MRDLLVTAAKDRRWEDLDCFAVSVSRSGFAGRKVIFVESVPDHALHNLKALGWEVRHVAADPRLHFQTWRFYPILDLLREEQFRYALVSDACDVVWQRDPVSWLEGAIGRHKLIVAAREAWKIRDQEINDIWVRRLVDQAFWQNLRELDVLCSGTIQGSCEAVARVVEAMVGMFGDEMQGIDQGIYNVVTRKVETGVSCLLSDPEDALVSTLGTFLAPSDRSKWTQPPPVLDWESGLVLTPGGVPYHIVHQYNRKFGALDPGGSWRETLERRYRS